MGSLTSGTDTDDEH